MRTNLILIICLSLLLFSCKKKASKAAQVDFYINDNSLLSLNQEYDEEQLELYKNDPDKVYYCPIGKEININANEDALFAGVSSWEINDKAWEQSTDSPNKFVTTFDVPGLYKITMRTEDAEITKFIRAIDINEGKISNEIEELSEDDMVIDFETDKERPNKWQAILFTDISKIGTEVKRRIWDFGDGTVIPTVGPSVKYSYSKSGAYRVKLCVNFSEKCTSKMIYIGQDDEMKDLRDSKSQNSTIAAKQTHSKSPSKTPKKASNQVANNDQTTSETPVIASVGAKEDDKTQAIELVEIDFTAPSNSFIGKPVRIQDISTPYEAIAYRNWYIDGVAQNFHQKTVDMIFDEDGDYEIKMCLNYLSKNCVTKTISVRSKEKEALALEEKKNRKYSPNNPGSMVGVLNVPASKQSPTPEFDPFDSNVSPLDFYCQSYGKAGLKSEYKCANDIVFFSGVSTIILKPHVNLELHTAKMYGNEMGFVDIILSDVEQTKVSVLKHVQILPGQTTIEFAEFAMTLEEGKEYEMVISTLPQNSIMLEQLALLNSYKCETPTYTDENLNIEYNNSKILYDLKYCY